MKLIIDITDEQVCRDIVNGNLEPQTETDKVIVDALYRGKPYEEKPFEINVFLENADESTLFDIKKELARILTDRAEREAYEEARREAMRLDDNEDTYKWRGHA